MSDQPNPLTASLAVATVFVMTDDPQASLDFYAGMLGCEVRNDFTPGDQRWITLSPPQQPAIEILLNPIGASPMSGSDRQALGDLLAKGHLGGVNFSVDDVDAVFEHVSKAGGEVISEPADQFYGVRDCAFRDPAGNLVRINSPLEQG